MSIHAFYLLGFLFSMMKFLTFLKIKSDDELIIEDQPSPQLLTSKAKTDRGNVDDPRKGFEKKYLVMVNGNIL